MVRTASPADADAPIGWMPSLPPVSCPTTTRPFTADVAGVSGTVMVDSESAVTCPVVFTAMSGTLKVPPNDGAVVCEDGLEVAACSVDTCTSLWFCISSGPVPVAGADGPMLTSICRV